MRFWNYFEWRNKRGGRTILLICALTFSAIFLLYSRKIPCVKYTDKEVMNPETFVPDTTWKYCDRDDYFPWDDVMACMKENLDSKQFKNHRSCPKCGLNSEKLYWIDFRSPTWTWEKLCGRAGPLSICPVCKIQVEFSCGVLN